MVGCCLGGHNKRAQSILSAKVAEMNHFAEMFFKWVEKIHCLGTAITDRIHD